MTIDNTKLVLLAAGAVLGLIIVKKNFGVVDAAAGAVGVIGDAMSGVVIGIGEVIGIPRTDETECEKAMREGRTWDASFACPAGTWLKYLMK
ncbi:hypothetical protein IP92_02943 [Pseudoduganella flava]|uniref:Uncharacterized protein n=1 Tax=Pseudoduganella flava TaxID=871742 RepID=A0A562PQ68_9BURK|nr:hypothetical protein [Pseudoduganella flava]QGZ37773.1 hypothetical protein GO485_01010 [Pseudoduganella flava]TWI46584.1 hypothetical protein IP92_02943 [Pseudoduganella flava]